MTQFGKACAHFFFLIHAFSFSLFVSLSLSSGGAKGHHHRNVLFLCVKINCVSRSFLLIHKLCVVLNPSVDSFYFAAFTI